MCSKIGDIKHGISTRWGTLAGDSWYSSKIIRADEKNTGFI